MTTITPTWIGKLDRGLPLPLHAQVSSAIRAQIVSGEWPDHYRLAPEPELAEDLNVSRGTLRRAITTLLAEGLLVQVRGRGTFVTSNGIEPAIAQRLSSLSEDFASQGIKWHTVVLESQPAGAPRPIASLLNLGPGQRVLRLVRIRKTDKGPVVYLVNFVRLDLTPGIENVDFTDSSLFGVIEERYNLPIASGRRTFSAVAADSEIARALEVEADSPVQYIEQVTYLADGRPIEYSDIWIHSERLRITSVLSRR